MSADDWNWNDQQLKFIQLVEHNQAREQVLAANGIQLEPMAIILKKIDLLAETVLTAEEYEQYHIDFALHVADQLTVAEGELNKRKLMMESVPDLSQMPRAERRRTQRQMMREGGSGLITPN